MNERTDGSARSADAPPRRGRERLFRAIVGWVCAAALALLCYDAGGAAFEAHRAGRPWLYPAGVSVICLLLLAGLTYRNLRGSIARRD